MKIVVKQTESNFKNEFEIFVNEEKKYFGCTPALNLEGSILQFDKKIPISIKNLNGSEVISSKYEVIENAAEEYIPFKYLFTKEQKFDQFTFNTIDGKKECEIYFAQQEYLKGNWLIKYNDKVFELYDKSDGYYKYVSIYEDDNQIAQIVKLNVIKDGNDIYTIFLKDEYSYLDLSLIGYTLYLDRLYFNYGFTKKSTHITYSKTHSKNDNKYNPNWLKENFDLTEFNKENEKLLEEGKKKGKLAVIIVAAVFVVLGIFFLIALLLK